LKTLRFIYPAQSGKCFVEEGETNSNEVNNTSENIVSCILDRLESHIDSKATSARDSDELFSKEFGVPLQALGCGVGRAIVEYCNELCTGHSSEELAECLAIPQANYTELESNFDGTIDVNENEFEACTLRISNGNFGKCVNPLFSVATEFWIIRRKTI